MGAIITIASQKGGVGKTTTAVNLAASLAVYERTTLVVGIDPQCGLWISFGRDREHLRGGMYNAVIEGAEASRLIHGTEIEYLSFIPSNIWTNDEETQYLSTINGDLLVVKRILDSLKGEYEFIIVDCPPSLGAATMAGIAAADYLLVPVQSEYFALKTIGRLMRMSRIVGARYNPNLRLLGFLLTMVDGRTTASREVAFDLRRDLKTKVFDTIIPRNSRLAEVPKRGNPAVLFDVSSVGARAYLSLAKEILEKVRGSEPDPTVAAERER